MPGFAFAQTRLGRSPSQLTLRDLDAPFIGAFLEDLETKRAASVRTRNLRLTAIRSFFRHAAFEERPIRRSVRAGVPRPDGLWRRRWEDTDHVGAPLDLAVEALDRICGMQLGAVFLREGHVGQHVGLGVVEDGSEPGHLGPDLVGDGTPLGAGGLGRLLGEDGGDEGRDDPAAALSRVRQHIPHEVKPGTSAKWRRGPW